MRLALLRIAPEPHRVCSRSWPRHVCVPRRCHCRRRRILPTLAVAAVALLTAACLPLPPPTPTILYYADSLGVAAGPRFAAEFAGAGYEVVERAFHGTALCDWFDAMAEDLRNHKTAAVVIQFSGNQSTPCILSATDVTAHYAADLRHAFDLLARVPSARIFVVAAPVTTRSDLAAFNSTLRAVTANRGGTWVTEAAAAVSENGVFAWDLTCLPDETPELGCRGDGRIQVRSADGVHFCPVLPLSACPPVYSSGARRFADGMAAPIRIALGA